MYVYTVTRCIYTIERETGSERKKREKKKRWFLTIDDCSSDRGGKKTNRQGNTESVARKPPLRSTILIPLPPSIQLSLSIFRYKCS